MSPAWAEAFRLVFDPYNIVVMFAASLFGLFVGAVPGLTATMATALLVPVTFFMPPIMAIAAVQILRVNTRFLPKEIQPPRWRQIGLVVCALFYGGLTLALLWSMIQPAK